MIIGTFRNSLSVSLHESPWKFEKIFSNLPPKIRSEDIIVVIEDKPYTWNIAYLEIVKNKSELGKEILKYTTIYQKIYVWKLELLNWFQISTWKLKAVWDRDVQHLGGRVHLKNTVKFHEAGCSHPTFLKNY